MDGRASTYAVGGARSLVPHRVNLHQPASVCLGDDRLKRSPNGDIRGLKLWDVIDPEERLGFCGHCDPVNVVCASDCEGIEVDGWVGPIQGHGDCELDHISPFSRARRRAFGTGHQSSLDSAQSLPSHSPIRNLTASANVFAVSRISPNLSTNSSAHVVTPGTP